MLPLQRREDMTPTFMFCLRAVVQFQIKSSSHPLFLGISLEHSDFTTHRLNFFLEIELCSRCAPNVLKSYHRHKAWRRTALWTASNHMEPGTFIKGAQTKSSPKQSLPQSTASAHSAASAPSALVCSLFILHLTVLQHPQADGTIWQILGLRYSYHKSLNNMHWEAHFKSSVQRIRYNVLSS